MKLYTISGTYDKYFYEILDNINDVQIKIDKNLEALEKEDYSSSLSQYFQVNENETIVNEIITKLESLDYKRAIKIKDLIEKHNKQETLNNNFYNLIKTINNQISKLKILSSEKLLNSL
jgi:hypothetical protein